jgi:hypothetical protein
LQPGKPISTKEKLQEISTRPPSLTIARGMRAPAAGGGARAPDIRVSALWEAVKKHVVVGT